MSDEHDSNPLDLLPEGAVAKVVIWVLSYAFTAWVMYGWVYGEGGCQ